MLREEVKIINLQMNGSILNHLKSTINVGFVGPVGHEA